MVSPVVLLLTFCVLAAHGQYDTEDYYYEYETPTETTDVSFSDVLDDWLYDLFDLKDECDPNPCLNGGRCDTAKGGFVCSCPEPYTGKKCSKVKNVCKNAKCGRGDCLMTKTAPFYECKCTAPYKPPACRKASPCKPSPCLNGGSCVKGRTRASFSCNCPGNYSGKFCQVDPNDCYQEDGENYRGTVSETEGGKDCLNWNSFFILEKGGDPFTDYPDFDGIGPHNNCRNPDGDSRPWCFVNKRGKLRWDHCNVRSCSGSVQPTPITIYETDVPATGNPTPAAEFSQCGKPQPVRTARIFGGMKSQPGAHPWQVSLQTRPGQDSAQSFSHTCGGILIESCWVLTAAHCINGGSAMRVVLGGVDIEKDEAFDQTIDVEKAIIHEKYREETFALYNDIALLKLKGKNGRCAKETRFVKTACLPNHKFSAGTECVISGWGVTETKKYGSNQLLNARVVLISQDRCKNPTVYGNVLDNSMFCAGNLKGGVDSCQGDSGGPLVCEQNGTHYVTGVVSWGDGCGKKNKPGVYADVTQFVDWIAAKIIA
ncbi:hyaluronan-binding protein 2 [Osmerus mordax]|uniref:hyaluronan-binding protein 2 n=1 Tax=Osmerus mordax TaxID=8014 RepID=UPI00350F7C9E